MTLTKEIKNGYSMQAVSFEKVNIEKKFWGRHLKNHKEVTINACLNKCESKGRIDNFKKAAGVLNGEYEGIYFNDSDVYKVLEGVAYTLINNHSEELENKADEIIDIIESAQQQDGYLDCYFVLSKKETRWTDMERHEDYCLGHMLEAAIAYKYATGKDKFLKVTIKMVENMMSVVGEGRKHWVPGHQEIELALVKLFHETGEEKYLRFASWLLEERGHGHGVGDFLWSVEKWGAKYAQDDKPIAEMTDIAGHAVRAMYMYAGICDVATITGNAGYIVALNKLWESVVYRNMYITGGIGSTKENEGFTEDYDLPNDTAYCETCASVGMVFWNHRMNLMTRESKYADIVEKELYNGVLCGLSYSGDKFFYVNPLESDGTHHRQEWYDVSCCPTQIARFIPSIGNYVYAFSDEVIWVNLYLESNSEMIINERKVFLKQETDYPWDEEITITVSIETPMEFSLNLRIPDWCKKFTISINGKNQNVYYFEKGYVKIFRKWKNQDNIELNLSMPIEMRVSHPRVKQNINKIALQRGPIIYCAEEIDNIDIFDDMKITSEMSFKTEFKADLLDGIMIIKAESLNKKYIFIPYYAWDNRGSGKMKVWIINE